MRIAPRWEAALTALRGLHEDLQLRVILQCETPGAIHGICSQLNDHERKDEQ